MINLTDSKTVEGEQAVVVDNQGTTTTPSAQPFEVSVGSVGANLLQALEAGMMSQAMCFMDDLDDELKDELRVISSFIKKSAASKNVVDDDDLARFTATLSRLCWLVKKVDAQVATLEAALDLGEVKTYSDKDVLIWFLKERVRDFWKGFVVYGRRVDALYRQSLAMTNHPR